MDLSGKEVVMRHKGDRDAVGNLKVVKGTRNVPQKFYVVFDDGAQIEVSENRAAQLRTNFKKRKDKIPNTGPASGFKRRKSRETPIEKENEFLRAFNMDDDSDNNDTSGIMTQQPDFDDESSDESLNDAPGPAASAINKKDDYISDSTISVPNSPHVGAPQVQPPRPVNEVPFRSRDRIIRRWPQEEEDYLLEMIAKYGVGNWRLILTQGRGVFHPSRTNVSLKDKYRVWRLKQKRLTGNDVRVPPLPAAASTKDDTTERTTFSPERLNQARAAAARRASPVVATLHESPNVKVAVATATATATSKASKGKKRAAVSPEAQAPERSFLPAMVPLRVTPNKKSKKMKSPAKQVPVANEPRATATPLYVTPKSKKKEKRRSTEKKSNRIAENTSSSSDEGATDEFELTFGDNVWKLKIERGATVFKLKQEILASHIGRDRHWNSADSLSLITVQSFSQLGDDEKCDDVLKTDGSKLLMIYQE